MADAWVSLTIELPAREVEDASELLQDAGARGLEVREPGMPLLPGVRAPSAGNAIVVAYFASEADAEAARGWAMSSLAHAAAEIASVPEQDWSESWKALIRAVEIGRLWVGPPWLLPQAPAGKERIAIEPKMAFGTGDHPTTSLCLEAVDAFLADHPGATVLDVGTGTGVLAIAARRLGAGRAVGIDNDPVCVELARENAAANQAPEVDFSGATLDRIEGRFDLVVANILANTLVELAPLIAPKVGRALCLAGVLAPQRGEVEAAYAAQGLVPSGFKAQGEWVRIDLSRP